MQVDGRPAVGMLVITAVRKDGTHSTRTVELEDYVRDYTVELRVGVIGRMIDCCTLWALGQDSPYMAEDGLARVVVESD